MNQKLFLWVALVMGWWWTGAVNAQVEFSHRSNPYATHQPVLYEIVMMTEGPIVEFGCGHGSTDLLHELCKKTHRLLISIDDDLTWLQMFAKKYQGDGYAEDNSGWHQFYYVPGKKGVYDQDAQHWIDFIENSELLQNTRFDLCFVDQSPWQGRFETIKRMKQHSKYIILHDCDYYPGQGIFGKTIRPSIQNKPGVFDFSDIFRWHKVYFPLVPWPGASGPPTLLGSDTESDLPEVDYNIY